jgi:hypothetical protein
VTRSSFGLVVHAVSTITARCVTVLLLLASTTATTATTRFPFGSSRRFVATRMMYLRVVDVGIICLRRSTEGFLLSFVVSMVLSLSGG